MSRPTDSADETCTGAEAALEPPWSMSVAALIEALETNRENGLDPEEARRRLERYGPNAIPEPRPDPLWKRYLGHLTGDAVVRLLLIGGIVSLLLGDVLEGVSILVMLNIMAGFGLWQEGKATDAARSLRQADNPLKLVVRGGRRQELPVAEIVPGDLVYLPTGAIAPADGRVVAQVSAEKDSSKLTGESLPVELQLEPLPAGTVVNQMANMVHRGDAITAGNASVIITSTGSQTELGKIAVTLSETQQERTPLDEQLDNLGDTMARVFIWIAVLVIGAGLAREIATILLTRTEPLRLWELVGLLKQAFINGVALIIAAIPEGLPAVLTITLAIATRVMVKRQALVRRPKAVEGGGSMNVLLTDKTGTLTANQMSVEYVALDGQVHRVWSGLYPPVSDAIFGRALRIARLCNNDSTATESAMMRWVESSGLKASGDLGARLVEHQFDQSLKRMTTVHESVSESQRQILTKGAPEPILELCRHIHRSGQDVPFDEAARSHVQALIHEMASQGLRVIALADRYASEADLMEREQAESGLTFVGLLGLMDPPRPDVAQAVERLRRAGVRTVMVTGDNPVTAFSIARQIGIIPADMPFQEAVITGQELSLLEHPDQGLLEHLRTVHIFARVTPAQKADIVRVMREAGFIVGMTGDGVNDAIALKRSDVGFAMGNGTDVARDASDVVLMDSRFSTIPVAVEEGRNVLDRIRLYLSYILSGNGCEVGAFIAAYLLNVPIPLTALVLLVINFATDSFPALAMTFEPGEPDVMTRQPRQRSLPFIDRLMWTHIVTQTVIATIVIMGVYVYQFRFVGVPVEEARSAAFMAYIFQKLYRAFTARSLTRSIHEIGLFRNRWTLGAVAISMSIALVSVYMPLINTAMGLAPLGVEPIALAAVAGLAPPLVEEATKFLLRRRGRIAPAEV